MRMGADKVLDTSSFCPQRQFASDTETSIAKSLSRNSCLSAILAITRLHSHALVPAVSFSRYFNQSELLADGATDPLHLSFYCTQLVAILEHDTDHLS
jgi:hypothetical protein